MKRGRPTTCQAVGWLLLGGLLTGSAPGLAPPPPNRVVPAETVRSAPAAFSLTSAAFKSGEEIPAVYTCDGAGVSPALGWTSVPSGARSLALVLDDPDAPDPAAPRVRWVHWILYNMPASSRGLPRSVSREGLPPGTLVGQNGWRRQVYGGPCPPRGRHRYIFKLYALDTLLPDLGGPDREALEVAMQGHVLAITRMVGLYRHQP